MIRVSIAIAAILALSCTAPVTEPSPQETALAFMDAYVAGDWPKVESHLTSGALHVYGSDLAEISSDRAGFKAIFDNDQKLWRGHARFGLISSRSLVQEGNLASLFFDRVFELDGRRVTVRFATVWRREGGVWKLVQSANVVPTVGQSAG